MNKGRAIRRPGGHPIAAEENTARIIRGVGRQSISLSAHPGSWAKMMAAVPVRNSAAQVETETDPPGVKLNIPTRKPRYFSIPPISWVVHPKKFRIIYLDEMGSAVWSLCDGTRTIEQIVDALAREHGLTFHESRVAVTQYIKSLIQRGALAVALE